MISGISKKVIYIPFLFINFIQPSKSADFYKINQSNNTQISQLIWEKISSKNFSSNQSRLFVNNFEKISDDKIFLENNAEARLAGLSEKQSELVIQSDKQSEINDIIYAEGNVSVSYRGKLFKADNLVFDKLGKKISAKGNITLIIGNQIFKTSELEYSFISEQGYLLDVQGSINGSTLIDDLSSNFSLSDFSKLESLLESRKKTVLHTPGVIENWVFYTEKMNIDGKIWRASP